MIYTVSNGYSTTGGPETLHQAASYMKSKGVTVYMYYINPSSMVVPEKFARYGVEVSNNIVDDEKNVLIVPEVLTYFLNKFKRIRKVIWWLSVDFFEQSKPCNWINWRLKNRNWPYVFWPAQFLGSILKGSIHFGYYRFKDREKYFHLYNCEYAHQYILSHGVLEKNTLYACGPLNRTFFDIADSEDNIQRENIVLYNPRKGGEYVKKIISCANERRLDAQFIAIQNMTSQGVAEVMRKAKVYMDFGFFPGPERIPREAVLLGCNIITSRRGSAGNPIDVPIPNELKYEDTDENIENIVNRLENMLLSYEYYYPMFDKYREKIREQVPLFEGSINEFLKYIS